MRLAWAADIHLNCASEEQVHHFFCQCRESEAEAVALCGDIGEAATVTQFLRTLAAEIVLPVYFILGNHDFYRGDFASVRSAVAELVRTTPGLTWLTGAEAVPLTERTGLLGDDGWADGRLGAGLWSRVQLNDFLLIQDLVGLPPRELFARLAALGDEAAERVRPSLAAALERFENLVFVTHAPPFAEACWYEGQLSDDDFLPHFTCDAMGRLLRETLDAHPDRNLTVLCGHSHGAGTVAILPNLKVITGGAQYCQPAWQDVLLLS